MQKRLLALVATVAMVLSMFAGVAFAAAEAYTVELTSENSIVTTGGTPGFYFVKGRVLKGGEVYEPATAIVGGIKVTGATTATADINTNGTFVFTVPTEGAPGQYSFELDQDKVGVKGTDTYGAPVTFTRKAIVELDKTSFVYKASPLEVITVTLRDANGNLLKAANIPNTDSTVVLGNGAGDATISNISKADGTLAFVVTSWGAGAPGELDLELNGVVHATIKVGDTAKLALSATPNYSIKKAVDTRIVFTANGPANATATLTATGPSGNYNLFDNGTTHTKTVTFDADGEAKVSLVHAFAATGTYKVTVSRAAHTSASVNLFVVAPTEGIVEAVKSTKLSSILVGTTSIAIGGADYEVFAIDANGDVDAGKNITYTVLVDGVAKMTNEAAKTIDVVANKTGEVKIRIMAYVNSEKKLDKVYTVKVTGWDVSYDVSTFTVNETKKVSFVVKDAEGKPVNNAKIYYGTSGNTEERLLVDPSKVSITDGVYSTELKFTAPATKNIYVYRVLTDGSHRLMAQFSAGIVAVGDKVWDVTSDVTTLLAGNKETVTLTVKAGDSSVIPARVDKIVGKTVTSSVPFTVSGNTIKVPVVNANTRDVTLRVMNATGDKIGEVVLNTVAPKLVVLNDSNNLTENVHTALKFNIVDPRDDSTIISEVELEPINATLQVKTADKKGTLPPVLGANETHEVAALVTDVDWDNLAEFEDEPLVKVKVLLDSTVYADTEFEVKEATLVSDPEQLILGQPANVTLTYVDANGKAIANKKVYHGTNASGTLIGTTDNEGKVSYATAQASSAAMNFAGATDVSGVFTTVSVSVTLDTEAPVVTAPETSNKNTATITIADNVRVTTLYVDGVKIDVIPRQEIKHVVNLKPGKNVFDIIAIDNNYNVAEETVVINYVDEAIVLKGDQVKRQGEFVFVQLRQFEELGAQVGWKQDTQTATFIVGDTKVEVTIGSLTAKVNGKAVTMPAAPFIDKATSRTYVPTRFIAEALNWNVHWAQGDVVTITLP